LSFCRNCLPAMTASNGLTSTQTSTREAVAGSVGLFAAALHDNTHRRKVEDNAACLAVHGVIIVALQAA
jgi:hypothetical protein